MPNVRLRKAYPNADPRTIVLRPLLAFAGVTRDSTGAVLCQASVESFRTLGDILTSREISDADGVYTVSVIDSARYYATAVQPANCDTTIVTADNTCITTDRTIGREGMTDNTLVGIS